MLITCPKCHSIYEIPDDLIGKTGQNFRCVNCTTVWHALRSDALGYDENKEEPFIEAIDVTKENLRNFPANKKSFSVPADSKSGRKTLSSDDIIKTEGTKPELTLTSDKGTSFTISVSPFDKEQKQEPHLFNDDKTEKTLTATPADHIGGRTKLFKGYQKTCLLLFLALIAAVAVFARREIVYLYPETEVYYNKIGLTGYNNPENLKFEQILAEEREQNGHPFLFVEAMIFNDSRYTTNVPPITVSGIDRTFDAKLNRLNGHKKTKTSFSFPIKGGKAPFSLTLGFKAPK